MTFEVPFAQIEIKKLSIVLFETVRLEKGSIPTPDDATTGINSEKGGRIRPPFGGIPQREKHDNFNRKKRRGARSELMGKICLTVARGLPLVLWLVGRKGTPHLLCSSTLPVSLEFWRCRFGWSALGCYRTRSLPRSRRSLRLRRPPSRYILCGWLANGIYIGSRMFRWPLSQNLHRGIRVRKNGSSVSEEHLR
jgi:hypothetical protein